MFDISVIKKVKYFPELLPGSDWYASIDPNTFATPHPLDIRRFAPLALELSSIRIDQNPNIELEIKADVTERKIRADFVNSNQVYNFKYVAKDYLHYGIANVGISSISNIKTSYGLWVYIPTIAEKMLYKWPVTQEEIDIANSLGLNLNIYPFTKEYMIDREYHIVNQAYIGKTVTVPASPDYELVMQTYSPPDDEFMVLRGFTCSNTDVANNIELTIDRDYDVGYLTYRVPAIAGSGTVKCWIPAMTELRITASAAVSVSNVSFSFDVAWYRLTDVLKARWNLASREEVGEDVWKRVRAGLV